MMAQRLCKRTNFRFVSLSLCIYLLVNPATVAAQLFSDMKPWFKLQDLTYENPGCKNIWSLKRLDHWLKANSSWIPQFSEIPYRSVPNKPWTGTVSKEEYETIEKRSLANGIGKGGVAVFTSTDMDKTVRDKQIMWFDINGDGRCDFIGWDYSFTGMSARGEQGHTVYYIFLQTDRGFKLVDYTNIGFERWGSGQIPDAILPVWIKGDKRPFLVARSDLYLISGNMLVVAGNSNTQEIRYRTALRWDTSQQAWQSFTYLVDPEVAYLITDFVKQNPPKTRTNSCMDTPVPCDAPR